MHHPLLPSPHVQTVLFCIHYETILIHKAVHTVLCEGHPSITPQMCQVQGPLRRRPHEIGVQSCPLLRTVHVHIVQPMNINRVCQGPQPTIHHAHSGVHHFKKCHTEQHQKKHRAKTMFEDKRVALQLSRFYSLPQKVTWVLWGSPKGVGGGGYPPPLQGHVRPRHDHVGRFFLYKRKPAARWVSYIKKKKKKCASPPNVPFYHVLQRRTVTRPEQYLAPIVQSDQGRFRLSSHSEPLEIQNEKRRANPKYR